MMATRTKLFLSLIAVFSLSTGACTRHEKSDSHTLVVGLSNRPTTLDPRFATDANSQRVSDLVFSSLVRNGPNLKPVPQAASSWKVENKKITFTLRNDLRFQDGRRVTAQDVAYSLTEYKKPASPFASSLSSIASVETKGEDQLVLHLRENDAPLLSNLNDVKILPREGIEKWGDSFGLHAYGSGPYRFVSIDNNQLILVKADAQSYAAPIMEKIVFKFIREDNTRFLKMIKGDLDVLLNELQEEKAAELKNYPDVKLMVTPGLNFNYILVNFKDERLKKREVRRALMSAIDRGEIIKYKLEGLAEEAASILAPSNPFAPPRLSFDLDPLQKAKKTIADLGMTGTEFILKTSDQGLANGEILAEQLQRVGVKIKLQSYEWGTFYGDVKTGHYQLATMRWVGIVDPDIYRESLDSHEFPPGKNRGYYSNPEFDGIVENARREIDFDKRRALYLKAQNIVAADFPIIPLWYNSNISVLNKRVRNFTPIITGSFYPLIDVSVEGGD